MSYHVSNLGAFSRGIPTDLEGYVHLTAEDWLSAPMDWGSDYPDDDSRREKAEELAEQARQATKEAEKSLADWQQS